MFEVGKKYRAKNNSTSVYECLYVSGDDCFMRNEEANSHFVTNKYYFGLYEEYKEPVVEKVELYFKKAEFGSYYAGENDKSSAQKIGKIKLTITDGVLTDAKVIKEGVCND